MTSPENESVGRVGTFDPRSSTERGNRVPTVFCRLLKAKFSSYLLPTPPSATFISLDLSGAVERGSKEQSKSSSFSVSWQPPMRVCFKVCENSLPWPCGCKETRAHLGCPGRQGCMDMVVRFSRLWSNQGGFLDIPSLKLIPLTTRSCCLNSLNVHQGESPFGVHVMRLCSQAAVRS